MPQTKPSRNRTTPAARAAARPKRKPLARAAPHAAARASKARKGAGAASPAGRPAKKLASPAKKKGAAKPAAKGAGRPRAPLPALEPGWVDAGGGYAITLDGRKLACRNGAGKQLASVPKEVQQGPVGQQLLSLRDWLDQHERSCLAAVDGWMLRSLPVARRVVEAVWEDPAWRAPLENALVWPLGADGAPRADVCGFLKAVDPARGLGIVDLDGETRWIDAERVAVPHPILLDGLDDLRELATELQLTQGVAQLFRETFPRTPAHDPAATRITEFAGGKFQMLLHATGKARTLGYRVRGGFASCPVLEGGRRVEARLWIGAEDPQAPTETGDLVFVDDAERVLPLSEVGPIAFSEGIRMARAIHAARVVEKEEQP